MNARTIPFKVWQIDEALRRGVRPDTIYQRIYRGRYPWLRIIVKSHSNRLVIIPPARQHDGAGASLKPRTEFHGGAACAVPLPSVTVPGGFVSPAPPSGTDSDLTADIDTGV